MTQKQYSEHAGVTHPAVVKMKHAGLLVTFPDGSVDAEATDRRRAEETNPNHHSSKLGNVGAKPIPPAAASAVSETLKEHGLPGSGTTYASARTANEVMKAQERRIKLQQLKGDIVDRNRATATVFRLARQERDALIGWPSRVASVMAADLGVNPHKMQTTLEKYVREHLEGLADLNIEFG